MLASTLLAAGLSLGGTAVIAGPAAADTGLKSVTISADNYQSYTDHKRDDKSKNRDSDFKRKWRENCEKKRGYDEHRGNNQHSGFWFHGRWIKCDDNRRGGRY